MVKLPSKRDIRASSGPAVSGAAAINIARPNINPGAARASQIDLGEISKEVIPDVPDADFSSERANIARLKQDTARHESEVARLKSSKSDDWVLWQKELARLSDMAQAEQDRQNALQVLEADTTFKVGVARIQYDSTKLPPNERPAYVESSTKALTDGITGQFSDKGVAERWGTANRGAAELAKYEALTESDKAARKAERDGVQTQLKALQAQVLETGDKNPEAALGLVNQIHALIESTDENGLDLFDPQETAVLRETYIKGLAKTLVEGIAVIDPGKAVKMMNSKEASKTALGKRESGNDYTEKNRLGYSGKYQFGAPRLADLGFYKFGPGEGYDKKRGWYGDKWSGTWNIPGFGVMTEEEFRTNPKAQEFVMEAHLNEIDDYIDEKGYDIRVGSRVNGVPITRSGMHSAAHIGGKGGLDKVMAGGDSRPDIFGTSSFDYMKLGSQYDWISKSMDPMERRVLEHKVNNAYLLNSLINNINDDQAGRDQFEIAKKTWLSDASDRSKVETAIKDQDERLLADRAMAMLSRDDAVWNRHDDTHKDLNEAAQTKYVDLNDPETNGAEKLVEIFEKSKIISKHARGQIEGLLQSENADQVVRGLEIMRELYNRAPEAFEHDMGEYNTNTFLQFSRMSEILDSETLFTRMQEYKDPSNSESMKTLRKEVINSRLKDLTAKEVAGYYDEGLFMSSPNAPIFAQQSEELLTDFKEMYSDAIVAGNSESAAKDIALTRLKNKWDWSDIGGVREIVELPPRKQAAYQVPGSDGKWIEKQLEEDLAPYRPNGERFVLRADPQSHAEKRNRQPVSYKAVILDDNGAAFAVPGRIVLDPTKEAKKIERQKAKQKAKWENSEERKNKLRDLEYEAIGTDSDQARVNLLKTGIGF